LSGLCEKRTRIAVAVILVLIAACYLVFLSAGRIERVLGETGRLVLTRLFGLLPAALAVQFVADSVIQIMPGGE
jgi:multiple antibiotic resistance protein